MTAPNVNSRCQWAVRPLCHQMKGPWHASPPTSMWLLGIEFQRPGIFFAPAERWKCLEHSEHVHGFLRKTGLPRFKSGDSSETVLYLEDTEEKLATPSIRGWSNLKWYYDQISESSTTSYILKIPHVEINNVSKTIINNPQFHHFYRWIYKPFPVMGGLWHELSFWDVPQTLIHPWLGLVSHIKLWYSHDLLLVKSH